MFRTDDPTDELSAAWGIKEQLRRLLATDTLAQAWEERMRMGYFTQIANMPEATKLYDTVVAWWDGIRGPHRHRPTPPASRKRVPASRTSNAPAADSATPRTTGTAILLDERRD